jgi:hypothetical protein
MWKHVELCDTHIETRGPKVIRIKWGFLGGRSRRFMGQPLRPPPIGAFHRGDSFGYYLVSPLFVSGVPGRVKSRPVSAFVGGQRGG